MQLWPGRKNIFTKIKPKFRMNKKGFSIVEVIFTVAIIGIVSTVGANLMIQFTRFQRTSSSRAELQKDARLAMDFMNRNIRQATAVSIVIDQASGQPPYSRISFTTIDSEVISYYQADKKLYQDIDGGLYTLTDNLKYVAFSYMNSAEDDIVSISLALEKSTYQSHAAIFKLSIEKVRIMN